MKTVTFCQLTSMWARTLHHYICACGYIINNYNIYWTIEATQGSACGSQKWQNSFGVHTWVHIVYCS